MPVTKPNSRKKSEIIQPVEVAQVAAAANSGPVKGKIKESTRSRTLSEAIRSTYK